MTKREMRESIWNIGWEKTFDNLRLADRQLFIELSNEFQNSIKEYMPFGLLEA